MRNKKSIQDQNLFSYYLGNSRKGEDCGVWDQHKCFSPLNNNNVIYIVHNDAHKGACSQRLRQAGSGQNIKDERKNN